MADTYDWHKHPNAPKSGTVLCPLTAIPEDQPKFFALAGNSSSPFIYFAVKRGLTVDVFFNRCPHKGLQLGTKEKKPTYAAGKLTCVQHRATFDVGTGVCVSGACPGASMPRIRVVVRDGNVVVA